MHVIAAKAVTFKEALDPAFVEYQKQVVKNAKALAKGFMDLGYHVISKGTDNHLLLIDVKSKCGVTGKEAETILHSVNITTNKNTIPNDTEKPFITSGIRIGSPAITSRGLKEDDMLEVVKLIDKALTNSKDEAVLNEVKNDVIKLLARYPLWYKW